MNSHPKGKIRVMRIIARMNIGGPAVQVSGLMQGLNTSEFEHRLYSGNCSLDEADYLEAFGTNFEVTRIPGLGRRVSLTEDVRALINLVRHIRAFKPDVIHTHTAKAGVLGRLASMISLHPSILVHTYHGHLLHGYFRGLKKFLVIYTERILSLFTDQLLAVGSKVRQDLLEVGVGKIQSFSIMPPGLAIGALPDKFLSKKSLGLDAEIVTCAFIGRVTQIKRPDRFLDVVAEIKRREVPIHFYIAGDGDLQKKCDERIWRENLPVTVLGWRSDIETILSAADIVLLTSDNEGTPLCLIQAGMAKIPVVTTDVGSISEIVINESTGLITTFEITSIADALIRLAEDPDLRINFGKNAQEFTLKNFSVKRLVSEHERLYMKLLSNRARF
jgi:glycosyltransferase involved in cell wall biosynthesis